MAINGNGVGTPMPRTNWNQTDPTKADYLKGREDLLEILQEAQSSANDAVTVANDAKSAVDNVNTSVNNHTENKNNPHGVTCALIGARPDTWVPTASEVGAAPTGYGLGITTPESITTTEQLDATRKTGFYRYAITGSTICGITFSYGSLIVYSITANSCVQEIRPYTTNYCLRRNYVNGTWSAWEKPGSSDFAPIGFGLGLTTPTAITSSEELDATRKCGFYRYYISSSKICGISFSSAAMIVYSNTTNSCVQEIRPHKTNYCMRRNYLGGDNPTWSEWELVGGVQQLLWKNASRTSSFAAQILSLDLAAYDEVLIYSCLEASTNNDYMVVSRCPVGERALAHFTWGDDNVSLHRFAKTSATGIEFFNAYHGGAQDNASLMPYLIYGIKGVSK